MMQLVERPAARSVLEVREAAHARFEFTVPNHERLDSQRSAFPNGLVASLDDQVRRRLAETLAQCGLTAIPVGTVAQSRTALSKKKLSIVLCDDHLIDGKYQDILETAEERVPVIVVSRTGDWPEYLKAIASGVFDYVAYPPISGELQRIIRNAFAASGNHYAKAKGQGL